VPTLHFSTVDRPNTDKPTDPTAAAIWGNWRSHIVSVNYLESQTNLNFFSNVDDQIQQILKAKVCSTAPLLAEDKSSSLVKFGSFDDTTIIEDSVKEESSEQIGNLLVVPGISEINFSQIGTSQISTLQISPTQISPTQISSSQITIKEISSSQISSIQSDFRQIDFSKIGTTQVNSSYAETSKLSSAQVNFDEATFTSSITLKQLLTSHNSNLQNTTVPTWTSFLQSPTPFNLKLEIADLPTGQLAESTITGYDTSNRPNSGTLTLDINGNGSGWFIDTTPEDNSEFTTQLADTDYQATADGAEYDDKYLY